MKHEQSTRQERCGAKIRYICGTKSIVLFARRRLLGIASDINDANRGWLIWFHARALFVVVVIHAMEFGCCHTNITVAGDMRERWINSSRLSKSSSFSWWWILKNANYLLVCSFFVLSGGVVKKNTKHSTLTKRQPRADRADFCVNLTEWGS